MKTETKPIVARRNGIRILNSENRKGKEEE